MKVTHEELLKQVKAFIGESTDDNALSLLENATDSLIGVPDSENWKAKYEENDAAWRKRYKERFELGIPQPQKEETEVETEEEEEEKPATLNDLIKWEENE